MCAGLQAPLTVPVLSIEGWIRPSVCVIMHVLVSVTVLYKNLAES